MAYHFHSNILVLILVQWLPISQPKKKKKKFPINSRSVQLASVFVHQRIPFGNEKKSYVIQTPSMSSNWLSQVVCQLNGVWSKVSYDLQRHHQY